MMGPPSYEPGAIMWRPPWRAPPPIPPAPSTCRRTARRTKNRRDPGAVQRQVRLRSSLVLADDRARGVAVDARPAIVPATDVAGLPFRLDLRLLDHFGEFLRLRADEAPVLGRRQRARDDALLHQQVDRVRLA